METTASRGAQTALKHLAFSLFLILLTVGIDQLTKWYVRQQVDYYENIPLIGSVLTLTKVENTGAFLSLGSNLNDFKHTLFMKLIPTVVLLGMFYYSVRHPMADRASQFGFPLVIGGGVGNLIDRFRFGSVTDFLHLKVGSLETGIFNVADMAIMLGVGLMLYHSYRSSKLFS